MFNAFSLLLKKTIKQFKESEILRKISSSFILKVLGTLTSFLLYIYISRIYGPETMGAYSVFIAMIGLAGIFSTLGMTSSVMRFVPDFISKQKFSELKKLKLIYFLLPGSLSVLLGILIINNSMSINNTLFPNSDNEWILIVIGVILPFYSLFLIGNEFARATGKTNLFEYFRSLHVQLSCLLLVIIITFFFKSSKIPIIVTGALFIVGFLILWLSNSNYINRKNRHKNTTASISHKTVLAISLPMLLTAFSSLIMERIDTLMIGYFNDNSDVGIYNVALKIAVLIMFLTIPVNAVLIPKLSEAFWNKDDATLAHYIYRASRFMMLSSVLIFLILLLFSELILNLFGKEFLEARYALLILATGYLVNACFGLAEHMLNLSGHEKKLTIVFTFGLIVNIILNYFLIPLYGINGAALATMSSMIIWNVLAGLIIKKHLGFNIIYIPFLKSAVLNHLPK
jgi:O-antigen/teichoic acid export membrane protein